MANKQSNGKNLNAILQKEIDESYKKLKDKFKKNGADENKLELFDDLFINAAIVICDLERIKHIPTIIVNEKYPNIMKQSDAGKARVKLIAQLRDTLSKLYRDILGTIPEEDDDLTDFE